MPRDPHLFQDGYELPLLGCEDEEAARALAARGLLTLSERDVVHCASPGDPDHARAISPDCTGRVTVVVGRDEADGAYACPECGRELRPSQKRRSPIVRLTPVPSAITAFVASEMRAVDLEPQERPTGILRAATVAGEAEVCLVDFCVDAAALDPVHARRDHVVYVVANPDFEAHVPAGATRFSLLDLALGSTEALRRRLRELAREGGDPVLPAVLARRAPRGGAVVSPAPSVAAKFEMPFGTTWSVVAFDWIEDEDVVRVRGPGLAHPVRCTQAELGWTRARDKWRMLKTICLARGRVADWRALTERHVARDEELKRFDAVKRQVARLRDDLQTLFRIEADPFKHCSREEGVHALFEANETLPEKRPWARLKIPELKASVRIGQPVSDPRSTTKLKEAVRPARPTR